MPLVQSRPLISLSGKTIKKFGPRIRLIKNPEFMNPALIYATGKKKLKQA
jgi:hypothetical protein